MKKIAIILALSIASLITTANAATVTVEVNGQNWDVSTVFGTYNDLSATLEAQEWWQNSFRAREFVHEVQDSLNSVTGTQFSPFFAHNVVGSKVTAWLWQSDPAGEASAPSAFDVERYYAVATVADPVPVPAAFPLMAAGLLVMGAVKRKRA